jgi:hypothetical protein
MDIHGKKRSRLETLTREDTNQRKECSISLRTKMFQLHVLQAETQRASLECPGMIVQKKETWQFKTRGLKGGRNRGTVGIICMAKWTQQIHPGTRGHFG